MKAKFSIPNNSIRNSRFNKFTMNNNKSYSTLTNNKSKSATKPQSNSHNHLTGNTKNKHFNNEHFHTNILRVNSSVDDKHNYNKDLNDSSNSSNKDKDENNSQVPPISTKKAFFDLEHIETNAFTPSKKAPKKNNTNNAFSIDMNVLIKESLYVFSRNNKFRIFLANITNNVWFNIIMIVIIMLNSFILVFETIPELKFINEYTNILFVIVFTLECIIKIIASGFVLGPHTYLKDNWNKLDFIIVLIGLIDLTPQVSASVLFLRTFRLFRPLKSMSLLPSMKKFISTLLNSLSDLSSVLLMMIFFYFIFALFGLSLWSEAFTYRCRTTVEPIRGLLTVNSSFSRLCGGTNDCDGNPEKCLSSVVYERNGTYFLDPRVEYRSDLYEVDLNWGITNFDNIGNAFYIVFQSATMENWSDIMYMIMDGHDFYIALIYFLLLIIIISFFILNLTVAVMLYNFEKYKEDVFKEDKTARTNKSRIELTHAIHEVEDEKKAEKKQEKEKKNQQNRQNSIYNNFNNFNINKNNSNLSNPNILTHSHKIEEIQKKSKDELKYGKTFLKQRKSLIKFLENEKLTQEDLDDRRDMRRKYNSIKQSNIIKDASVKKMKLMLRKFNKTECFKSVKPTSDYHKTYPITFAFYSIYSQPIIQYFIYCVIILNCIVLTLERVGQTVLEQQILEILNIIFVSTFAVECVLLIVGIGFNTYVKDLFNVGDFIVTIVSIIELMINAITRDKTTDDKDRYNSSIASMFRILRILRLFKLVRSWQNFRIIIISLKETLIRMIDYSIIFCLFVYIYSLFGFQIFNGGLKYDSNNKYHPKGENNIFNFDTFADSILSVFQIIIGDNWPGFYFDCYRSNNISKVGAVIYYVSLVLFGRITLLNIFLAYLIDNFQSARKFLKKNVLVKEYIDNILFHVSSQHDEELVDYLFRKLKEEETNRKKNKEKVKELDVYLDHQKRLLSGGKFKITAKIELDFYSKKDIQKNIDVMHDKAKRLFDFDTKYEEFDENVQKLEEENFF